MECSFLYIHLHASGGSKPIDERPTVFSLFCHGGVVDNGREKKVYEPVQYDGGGSIRFIFQGYD